MEEAYSNLNNAYLQIKGMIVVEGFYALVAGFDQKIDKAYLEGRYGGIPIFSTIFPVERA